MRLLERLEQFFFFFFLLMKGEGEGERGKGLSKGFGESAGHGGGWRGGLCEGGGEGAGGVVMGLWVDGYRVWRGSDAFGVSSAVCRAVVVRIRAALLGSRWVRGAELRGGGDG